MKSVLFREKLLKGIESFSKLIFAGDGVNAGEVVDGLVKMHAYEGGRGDGVVSPAEIPVASEGLIDDEHAYFLSCFSDDGIVGDFVREAYMRYLL